MDRKKFQVVTLHQENIADDVVEESQENFKHLENLRRTAIAFYRAGAKDKDSKRFDGVERNIYRYRKRGEE